MQKLLPHPANSGYSFAENRYKPIVLITYEQAIAYCAWRSKFVSGLLGKKIKYRLPTATEWKEIAEEVIKNDIKQIEIDLTETKKLIQKDSGQYVVIGIEKPKSRIYNLFDNVSEMTLDKGIAMGSNNYNLDDLKTNLTNVVYHYNATNSYLGFRCVAEKE
jgi:formylglycine-generating enzyme required for sulfatase activity